MATQYWLGQAAAIPQIQTHTVGGTWVAAETITITIGSQDSLVITVGTSVTTTDIAEMIFNALKGNAINNDETRTTTGDKFGEIAKLTFAWTDPGGVAVVATGADTGEPYTFQMATDSISGTISNTTTQAPGGPNMANDAENWTGGTTPGAGDSVVFDEKGGAVDCKWNVGMLTLVDGSIDIKMGYTGKIGLPDQNTDTTSLPFAEYRQKGFAIDVASPVTIGEGPGTGSDMIRLNAGGGGPEVRIKNSATKASNVTATIELAGMGSSSIVNVHKGDVFIPDTDGSAIVTTLNITYVSSQTTDAQVVCNATATNINKEGGNLVLRDSYTTLNHGAGTMTIEGSVASAGTSTITGGTVYDSSNGINSGTYIITGSATLDFSRDERAKTVSNPIEKQSATSTIRDPGKRVASLIVDCNHSTNSGLDDIGSDIRLTRAATA